MSKKVVFIALILVLCITAFAGTYYAMQNSKAYQILKPEIAKMEQDKAIVVEHDLDFINESQKYDFIEIDKNFYYGYENVYEKDEVLFISTVSSWDQEKLEELATELYANKHGEEINYVEKVVVSYGGGGNAVGSHSQDIYPYEIPVSLYNFLPEDFVYDALYKKSSIYIYGVNSKTNIEDLSFVLSHEYGHHYTFYHFSIKGNEEDIKTDYFKLRSQDNEKIITNRESYKEYIENHKWYLAEIAAEDYVYLMGSENTQEVLEFIDNFQKYNLFMGKNYTALALSDYDVLDCKNAIPHENVEIPMPIQVSGLPEYYFSFIDDEYSFDEQVEPLGTLNLDMNIVLGHQYNFTWDQPYTDPEVIYTLIGYDEDGNVIKVVKTTNGNDEGIARLGDYSSMQTRSKQYEDLYAYEWEEGKKMEFRVSITFPDGTVLLSDPVEFTNEWQKLRRK